MYVPIDGELRSAAEIIHMNTLQDYSAACFTARGRAYEVRVYYDCGGQTYEVYEDGISIGAPLPNGEDWLGCARRVCDEMGGRSFRIVRR